MKLIGTSKPNAHFFLLIGTPVLSCMSYLIRTLYTIKDYKMAERPFLMLFVMFSGELISFLFIINKFEYFKPTHKAKMKKNTKITYIQNRTTTLNESFPYFIVTLTSITDFVSSFVLLLANSSSDGKYREGEIQIIQIFITMTICYLCFHCLVYKHQALSIMLITIGSILLYLADESFILTDLWFVGYFILNSAKILNDKWVMERRYTNPFKILSFEGLVGLVITIVIMIIGTFTCEFPSNEFYCESFSMLSVFVSDWGSVGYFILFVVLYCLLNSGRMLILKHYDPNMTVVTMSITNVLILLFSIIFEEDSKSLSMYLIGNVLILSGALVYNEIIILYCFGLGDGTKKEIFRRSQCDMNEISINLEIEDSGFLYDNSNEIVN